LNRTRIKVCGMTRVEDVRAAVSMGVDAIGLIFHPASPRFISIERAQEIRKAVPAFVSLVGVFVDAEADFVVRHVRSIGLDTIQLHGVETHAYTSNLSCPYIKALRVQSSQQIKEAAQRYHDALGLLLDPYVKGQHGGTGQLLDQRHWPSESLSRPLILAGGLSADNVAQRVNELAPYAVDLNSGVEVEPGVKDLALLQLAINEVEKADKGLLTNKQELNKAVSGDRLSDFQ